MNPTLKKSTPFVALLLCLAVSIAAPETPLLNPVARCADCVMLKHRGTYYMTGTGAEGEMLVSKNLADWEEPIPFFQTQLEWTDEQHTIDLHAPGLKYYNGTFYFYWNGIACATAEKLFGPYADLSLTQRFDGEIDPFLFIDEDGSFYFYTVKFDHGNIIYGQEMKSPLKLKNEAVRLLEPRLESWETRDGHILEGPEVIRYRNTYFMLYAANHTRTSRGQYLIGCASSDSPLGFNEESKYPYPVMEQSDERIADSATSIIARGAEWSFTTHPPADHWMEPDFEVATYWPKGNSGFGWPLIKSARNHTVKTPWKEPEIWLRKPFELPAPIPPNLQLQIRQLGSTEIYLNGKSVYSTHGQSGPRLVTLTPEDLEALRVGTNLIAVYSRERKDERYIDVGLIDPGAQPEDDLIWNTGQPNLVRGPNGFEWFVTYFAMWNRGPHSQGINRTFFFNRELHIDGPTGSRPPQYQPRPYPATFSDTMDYSGEFPPQQWNILSGDWIVANGQAEGTPLNRAAISLIRAEPKTHYLFQAWLKPFDSKTGDAGIVAWYADPRNNLLIHLDSRRKKLVCTQYTAGKKSIQTYPLGEGFNYAAYHKIRFEKNADLAEIWVDDTRLTLEAPLKLPHTTPGIPGLFAQQTRAAFDAVAYTIGWDEHSERIRGWKQVVGSQKNMILGKPEGLVLNAQKNRVVCTKGDGAEHYEFSVQLSFMESKNPRRKVGVFPVYIDPQNYLFVELKPKTHRMIVSGKRKGEKIEPIEKDLAGWERLYLKTQTELHLKRPGRVSSIKLRFNQKLSKDFALQYHTKIGGWKNVGNGMQKGETLKFTPVETDAFRVASSIDSIVRAHAWIESEPSINLRIVKLRDKVLIMINGKQELEIPGEWPTSQVGLSAENGTATFNGITCFEIP